VTVEQEDGRCRSIYLTHDDIRIDIVSLFAWCFVCSLAESGTVLLDASLDAYVQQICDDLHVPGLSLAVVRKDSFESKVGPEVYRVY
jgi:hypothetical protein